MAKRVLLAAHLTLNAVNISSYCKKIELNLESTSLDSTTYGSGGWNEFLGGLKSGELSVEFFADYAASDLDSQLFAILGSVVTFSIRPDAAVVSTSNPQYAGSVHIKEHKALQGGVGDLAMGSVGFPTSGAVTRATA